jgi:hypothetical protein
MATPMNPDHNFVSSSARLVETGRSLPLGGSPPHNQSKPPANAPVIQTFSPRPDDECLIGGFARCLMREVLMRVVNIAVTQGSNKDRQQPRWQGMKNACGWPGFEVGQSTPGELEKNNSKNRMGDSKHWFDAENVMFSGGKQISATQYRMPFSINVLAAPSS